jgi:hypothetical protein
MMYLRTVVRCTCLCARTYIQWCVRTYCISGCVEGSVLLHWCMYTELRTPDHTCSFMHEKCFCSLVFSGDKCDFVCNSRDVVSQVIITVD